MIERAVILSTGDELTTGRIADTNAQWLANKLFEMGVDLVAVLTVGDFPDRLEWAWRRALELGDLVISTGGIGPTADDLTTETIGRVLGRTLVEDEPSADRIRRFFASRGVEMPLNNLKQALLPTGGVIIPNPLGTAPGYRVDADGKHLVVLPGVPREMKPMVEDAVLPWIRSQRGGDVYLAHVFQTFGISESGLDELVAGAVDPAQGRVSFRASFPEISLRVVVNGAPDEAERRLAHVAAALRSRIGEYAYGEGATTMEEEVGKALKAKRWTLALAESCTGGLVAHRITNVAGSSAYFLGGIGAYANAVKQRQLGVQASTLDQHGAVSEQTAREMATGVRAAFGADVAVATTGIAGPDGGTKEKPVGMVCFALASEVGGYSATHQLWGTRDWIKLLASQVALDMVRRHALGLPAWDPALFRRR
jgi:nicotinamide-nucleotide amidase